MKATEMVDKMKDNATCIMEQMNDHTEQIRKTGDSAYENASRELKKAKAAADEMVEDSRYAVRKDPLTYVGVAAVAGIAFGFAIGLFTGFKSRKF